MLQLRLLHSYQWQWITYFMTIVYGRADLCPLVKYCEVEILPIDRSLTGITLVSQIDPRWIQVKSDLNVNARMRTEIDLNECVHFVKANWDRSKRVWTLSQSKLRTI